VWPQRHSNRRRPHCNRWLALRGSFKHPDGAGFNHFRFSGRLAGKKLAPGNYRLVATAKDPRGQKSAPARTNFRIVR
jgi:hypothetical protein